jgi:sucrose phosphorylase
VVRDQLRLMRLRNTCTAFRGDLEVRQTPDEILGLTWRHGASSATLLADLRGLSFSVVRDDGNGSRVIMSQPAAGEDLERAAGR